MSQEVTLYFQLYLLLAYATISATIMGFIGLVQARRTSSKGLDGHEASANFHFMYAGINALFISLLAVLTLQALSQNLDLAWRLLNGLSALVHVVGTFRLATETWRHNKLERYRGWLLIVIGTLVAALNIAAAAGQLPGAQVTIFLLATLWLLAINTLSFITMIVMPSENLDNQATPD